MAFILASSRYTLCLVPDISGFIRNFAVMDTNRKSFGLLACPMEKFDPQDISKQLGISNQRLFD